MEGFKMGIDRKTHRLREEIIARKRNQEHHKLEFWKEANNYYRSWNLKASKHNVWASQPQSPINNERAKELEKENLKIRRTKLAELLNEEKRQLDEEMKEYLRVQKKIRNSTANICKDDRDSGNVDTSLEENNKHQRETSMKDYEQIKSHPVIQTIERKRNQDSMIKSWMQQIKEKQLQEEYEKKMSQKLEAENEMQRVIEEENEKKLAAKREEEIRDLKNYLLIQMQEVKKKDELTQQLKLQEQQEIELKTELERIAIRRQQIERERKTRDFRSFLRHQYQSQLKQRARQIQEQLEEDKRLTDEISRCLEQQETKNNSIREEARKEVDRANAILTEYIRIEKQREREMEFMFFEEARKLWQKQELQWSAEQEARNNLMRDVLVTIQKQIKEKLQTNTEQHEALANEKEDLLRRIEELNNQLKEAMVDANEKKRAYKQDLQKQIQEKESEKINVEEEKCREYLEQQAKLKEEEERILQELKKLNVSSIPQAGKITNLWR